MSGRTRLHVIEAWLEDNHRGEPFVIIDDVLSETGLAESQFVADGRVVLCKVSEGLHRGYMPRLRAALAGRVGGT